MPIDESAKRTSRTRTEFIVVVVGLALLAFVAVQVAGRIAERELERRLGAYVANGEPVTLAQLEAFIPEVAQARNTAARFQEEIKVRSKYLLSEEFARIKRELPTLEPDGVSSLRLATEDVPVAAGFIEGDAEWLAVLHEASRCEGLSTRDHRGHHSYAGIRHPFTVVVNHGVGCLVLEALVRIHRGDAPGAVESASAAKSLNAQLLTEPYVVNLVSALCREREFLQVIRQVAASPGGDAVGPQLLRLATPRVSVGDIRRSFRIERLGGLDFHNLQNSPFDFEDADSFTYLACFPRVVACRKVDQYLDFMDGCVRIFDLPGELQAPVALALDRSRRGTSHESNPLLSLAPPIAALTQTYVMYQEETRALFRELRTMRTQPDSTVGSPERVVKF